MLHILRAREILRCAIVSFAVFLFSQSQIAYAEAVGAVAGQFSVSESGAATHTIPIAVPPGTAGMEPKLALSYNSHGGNGLLGMGWSIEGLSAITRCPQTIAQDGVKGSVNYDDDDRFCLDGQRLINISGAYGGHGTVYGTEIESFSKIVSYGRTVNGPGYFVVWTKAGQIMEYGRTQDSFLEAQGKATAMAWALNKVQDTSNNYFTVSYTEDNSNGQSYPSRIDYGGNSVAGTAPDNSIQFVYEARPDNWTSAYQAGSLIKSTVRLKNVQTFAGTMLVKDFRLGYEVGAATARSKLTSVTECAANSECLPPTVFAWQQGVSDFDPAAAWANGLSTNMAATQVGDFDGDGKTDIVQFGTDSVSRVWFSNGAGFNGPNLWGQQHSADMAANQLGDFNGDGKTDVITFAPSGCASVWLSTGPQFNAYGDWGCGYGSDMSATRLGDFSGDGKTDIMQFGTDGVSRVWFSTGGGVSGLNLWGQYHGTNMAPYGLASSMATGRPILLNSSLTGAQPYGDLSATSLTVTSIGDAVTALTCRLYNSAILTAMAKPTSYSSGRTAFHESGFLPAPASARPVFGVNTMAPIWQHFGWAISTKTKKPT